MSRYLRTRRAILNGEKLFDLSGDELSTRGLMRPLTLNLYKTVLAALPAIAIASFISWRQQIDLGFSLELAQIEPHFWNKLMIRWQVVRAIQHIATAFVVP